MRGEGVNHQHGGFLEAKPPAGGRKPVAGGVNHQPMGSQSRKPPPRRLPASPALTGAGLPLLPDCEIRAVAGLPVCARLPD